MKLTRKTIAYITLIFAISIILIYLLAQKYSIADLYTIVFWIFLGITAESLPIHINNGMGVSVGFAVYLSSMIIGGPLTVVVVSSSSILFRVQKSKEQYIHIGNIPIYKSIFNASQYCISTGIASLVYVLTGGVVGLNNFVLNFNSLIWALVTYIFLNSSIISGLLSIITSQSFLKTWLINIKGFLPSTIAIGAMGYLLALAYITYGYGAVILFFGPLLLARYSFKLYMDMRHMYIETIQALNKSLEAKDSYTSGHASRVQQYAVELARAIKLSDNKIENIKTAAVLHDIGKIGVEDYVLNKDGKLTEQEYGKIKLHPTIGFNILREVDFLKRIAVIIKHHHERYDGQGYPDSIGGDKVPIESYILSIADAYDAMTSDRPYRKGLLKEQALEEIVKNSGTQFHPYLGQVFVDIMSREGANKCLQKL